MCEKISERAAEEVAVKVMSFRGARGDWKALESFEREVRTLRNLVGGSGDSVLTGHSKEQVPFPSRARGRLSQSLSGELGETQLPHCVTQPGWAGSGAASPHTRQDL